MISLKSIFGGTGSFKNRVLITASASWTVPAGVYSVLAVATGAGGAGCGNNGTAAGGGGAGGGTAITILQVSPGDVLNTLIGAGGIGSSGASGGNGGFSVVRLGYKIAAVGLGGVGATIPGSLGVNGATSLGDRWVTGGNGGNGGNGANVNGATGQHALPHTPLGSTFGVGANPFGPTLSIGGTGNPSGGGGGGGGSSYYGVGGAGGNSGVAGANAPALSYGAGGGGAGGSAGGLAGGNGANGVVEIWY